MIWFILAALCFMLFISFLLVGALLKKDDQKFSEGMKIGKARVVGYYSGHDYTWETLAVEFPDLNDGKAYNCEVGKKIRTSDYPVGTMVDVAYAPVKTLGLETLEVHLLDNPPVDKVVFARGFQAASIIALIIFIAFTIIGIIKLFG